jgi:putative glycerol-1-phosphate prenyltransferase
MNAKFQKLYKEISIAFRENKRLLPILLESDKVEFDPIKVLVLKINQFPAAHLFIGKRCVCFNLIENLILAIKECTFLPKLLFPRHSS